MTFEKYTIKFLCLFYLDWFLWLNFVMFCSFKENPALRASLVRDLERFWMVLRQHLIFQFFDESRVRKTYSLKNRQSIVFEYTSKLNDVHAINWIILWWISGLKNFFDKPNNFLNWDIDPAADLLIKAVHDMKTNNDYVSVSALLRF